MKLLVLADTHGDIRKASGIISQSDDIDYIIHLGDYYKDAESLKRLTNIPIIAVAGNCDGDIGEYERIFTTPYGRIFLTHGHRYGVKNDYMRLVLKAQEEHCIAAFAGHTHKAYVDSVNGIQLLNPGSLTNPKDGSHGTYGIVSATKSGIDCSVIYMENDIKRRKVTTGKLRSKINYSDRF